MAKMGIDVSHHQGVIDWNKVKNSSIEFAMIRACYGWDNLKQIDKQFKANATACEKVGMPYGLFHYSYAMSAEDAVKEAKFFLRVIKGFKPTYPIAFDFEEPEQLKLPAETQIEIITAFLDEIENAGYYTTLYMSASPLEVLRRLFPTILKKYDCWVAHVGVAKPSFYGDYGMWQYSWKGKVNGINGDVDLDYSYRDYEAIINGMESSGIGNPDSPQLTNKELFDEFEKDMLSLIEKYKALIK